MIKHDSITPVEAMTTPRLIDTHVHLDEPVFAADLAAVVQRAVAVGVDRFINIAYRPERWESSDILRKTYPMISFATGLHPSHSNEFSSTTMSDLADAIRRLDAVAVGEIGLDYFRPGHDAKLQKRAFLDQLDLAASRRLPVVIHQRSAELDCGDILRASPADLSVILHSFDGSWELGRLGIDRGYYFGVGGLMTRSGASVVREILATVPGDRLLLETDAPYLTPNGVKARRNEPANIPLICARLAALRGEDVASVASQTTANAVRAFDLRHEPEVGPDRPMEAY